MEQTNYKLIGTKGYPVDNSYSKKISTGEQAYLAGTYDDKPHLVTIVSEPYKLHIERWNKTEEFVTVLFKNELYIVLNQFQSTYNDWFVK